MFMYLRTDVGQILISCIWTTVAKIRNAGIMSKNNHYIFTDNKAACTTYEVRDKYSHGITTRHHVECLGVNLRTE